MKRILLLSFVAAAMLSSLTVSAQQPQLKSESDSLSYAFGAMIYEQGIAGYLQQSGVTSDTAMVRLTYTQKMEAETNAAKKTALQKELNFKLDSINKANTKNIADFIQGMKDAISAPTERTSYLAGMGMGGQMAKQALPMMAKQMYGEDSDVEMDPMLFVSGLEAALAGKQPAIVNPMEYLTEKMQETQARLQEQKEQAAKAEYAGDIAAGEAFLAENMTKDGVVTLPSGLQYKVLTQGTGAMPTADDQVKVHYEGRLIDGSVFDSSLERGEPLVFGVTQVIKGWTEALQLMPVGSKWEVYVPYELGYGARGAGEMIKPYATLIFTIELLGIEE